MVHIYWLEKLVKKIIEWFKKKRGKKETFGADSSVSLSPSIAAISDATSVSKKFQNDLEELTNELKLQKDEVNETKNKAKQVLDEVKDMKALMMFGLFIMLLMVVGLVFGYWQYIYDSVRRDDYKYGFFEKINNQNQEILKLKEENKKLLETADCQKNKKYWQYEECFK